LPSCEFCHRRASTAACQAVSFATAVLALPLAKL